MTFNIYFGAHGTSPICCMCKDVVACGLYLTHHRLTTLCVSNELCVPLSHFPRRSLFFIAGQVGTAYSDYMRRIIEIIIVNLCYHLRIIAQLLVLWP